MIYSKTFRFKEYLNWDMEIHIAVKIFKTSKGMFPNIMLANKNTFDKIDLHANQYPERIKPGDAQQVNRSEYDDEEDFKEIGSFCTEECELEFCLDNELDDDSYTLVYDDNPDFFDDGDMIEIVKTVTAAAIELIYRRRRKYKRKF